MPVASAAAHRPTTERVTVDSAGGQANGDTGAAAINADGRYIAFFSFASNLVAGDTNNSFDVFLHDDRTHVTERVSVDSAGGQANSSSDSAKLSATGRYVTFDSFASNLVAGDTNGRYDVFVHDRQTGATERVSLDSAGGQADADCVRPAISADGRYIAFYSRASNLVPGDTNDSFDVFVRDRRKRVTERVSVGRAGVQVVGDSESPAISADGRHVAFFSQAPNLVPGHTSFGRQVYLRDRRRGVTERVSVNDAGSQADGDSDYPAISADGRYVAFHSFAANLVAGDTNGRDDVFVRDRQRGVTEWVSVSSEANGDPGSSSPAISADGRYVAFQSFASDLVSGDTNGHYDVFVRDRRRGATERLSVADPSGQANGDSFDPAITRNGRQVAFNSLASNLVPGDTNAAADVFLRGAAYQP